MYDKSNRPPPVGSYREALFLTLWLRRQEAELYKARIMAQGLAQIAGSNEPIAVYKTLSEALFPFLATAKAKTDTEMIEKMKKEVQKGPIAFNEVNMKFIKDRAQKLTMPTEYQERLRKFRDSKPPPRRT